MIRDELSLPCLASRRRSAGTSGARRGLGADAGDKRRGVRAECEALESLADWSVVRTPVTR